MKENEQTNEGGGGGGGAREERERKEKNRFSQRSTEITVGFHRSKRQSRSTHRELHVGTKILEFRQTSRGREFSYFSYF